MVNILNAVLYGVGGLVCTCVALLVVFQEKLVYVPVVPGMSKKYPVTPARFRLPYEDIWLLAADGVRLHSWFIRLNPPCPEEPVGLLKIVKSLVSNFRFRDTLVIQWLVNRRSQSRGYGESDGYPSQHGIMKDAQAALDHLHQRTDIDTSRIIIFGRSLGGAVGASLAKNNPDKVAALILENTFTSILDMAGVMLPVLKWFIGGSGSKGPKILNFVVRSPWNTIDIIDQINQPMLFLSGSLDEMVPPLHMHCLFEKVKGRPNCYFVEFPTGMHMDTWHVGGDRYWQTIQQFINREARAPDDDDEQLTSNGWEKEWGEKANI